MPHYDVLIIGGGASGLFAACALARRGRRAAILERQPRVGRKLLSTGNGRYQVRMYKDRREERETGRA